ncbi:hypothetical protein EAG_01110 [Camponotus floridanus]|uniref:Uncharacterized protein n=1 Tax=Camponotus floridanus TaxID=104421 RepID=E2AB94_CAMFO|nr:hypothetical protein EAG_01110 [Camponotus floridanus]
MSRWRGTLPLIVYRLIKSRHACGQRIALDIRGVDSLLGSAERDVFLLDGWVPRTAEAFRRGLTRGSEESEQENGKKRSGCVDENTAMREREVRMVAGSSGGIQIHVDAAQSGVHHFSTHSHPSYPPTPHLIPSSRQPLRHWFGRSYRSRQAKNS